jgi:hydrogenase-4 membrane subunit HyfE
LLGLAGQGALMALLLCRAEPVLDSPGNWLLFIDLAVLRGVLAPLALYGVLRARKARARNDVIPPDLLSWTVAIAMVLLSFSFASALVPASGEQQTLVAVASAGLIVGFLVLSTGADPLSQVIGALRIENAIVLFELGGARHAPPLFLQIGFIGVFVVTVVLFAHYLDASLPDALAAAAGPSADAEGPTL